MSELILCKYCQKHTAIKYSKYSSGEFCSKECARGYSTKEKRKIINTIVSIKSGGFGNLELPPEPTPQQKRRVDSLRTVLFHKIHNEYFYGNEKNYYEWALIEGYNRLYNIGRFHEWEFIDAARKEHICIRECKILEGELYFKYNFNSGYGDYDKVCTGCFALILYHQNDLDDITPYSYSHYDLDNKKPCLIDSIYESKELESYKEKHRIWQQEIEKIKINFLNNK